MATDRILVHDRAAQKPTPFITNAAPVLDSAAAPWIGLKLQHYRVGDSESPEVTTKSYLAAVCLGGSYQTEYLPNPSRSGFRVAWKRGDVFLTGPGELPARRSTGNVEFLLLEVAPKYVIWAGDELAASAPFEICPQWGGKEEQLRYLMLTLHHELLAQCPSGRLFGEYLGLSFATAILTRHSAVRPTLANHAGGLTGYKLRQVIAFIDDNLTSDISLADMANLAEMTPCHFARAFKASTGVSPHQHILRRRIERALRALKGAQVSLSALADELGFSSQGHFTAVFRKMVGVSPGSYREQLRSLRDLEVLPSRAS